MHNSSMNVHARIQTFLQQQTVVPLAPPATVVEETYLKAGVVPFVRGQGVIRYCLMKPVAKRPGLSPPAFQICKGTRMRKSDNGWIDMREPSENREGTETLTTTALREGIEELGINLEAITGIFDVGPYRFSSAHTGSDKHMWLYALEMASVDELLPMEHVEKSTAERGWLTADEFAVVGRDDHRYILRDIADKLEKYLHGHAAR